jgi:hypothetical protein
MRFGLGPLVAAAVVALSTVTAWSQEKTFDAVSIKRNRTGAAASDTNTTPGRLSLVNVTMLTVILRAFRVQRPQVVGAPDWAVNERYDIVAVTGDATALSDETRQAYLRFLPIDASSGFTATRARSACTRLCRRRTVPNSLPLPIQGRTRCESNRQKTGAFDYEVREATCCG